MFLLPGDRAGRGRKTPFKSLLSMNVYSSSQTIVIPTNARQALVLLIGGGAGTNGSGSPGGAGSLWKYLTNLKPACTLVLTIGAAGASGNHAGGNSTLVSGTQPISTLTANGAAGVANSAGVNTGGTATGGDYNITGGSGTGGILLGGCAATNIPGGTLLSPASGTGPGCTQVAGTCWIWWFA